MKCITFDKEAQDALPEHIKQKMEADREAALRGVRKLQEKVSDLLEEYKPTAIDVLKKLVELNADGQIIEDKETFLKEWDEMIMDAKQIIEDYERDRI